MSPISKPPDDDGNPNSIPPEGPAPDPIARGASIGRYVVVDRVGHGGMGVVYAAYDSQLDRKIAIKLLRPDLGVDVDPTEVQARLLREAQAMARLSHPNVIAIFDVGTYEDKVFLAMEFIDGITLTEWLRKKPPREDRLRVIREAGRGLSAAHKAGLIHRDFKPDNVLVGKDGRVVVLDFGLARAETETLPDLPALRLAPPAEGDAAAPTSSLSMGSCALSSQLTGAGAVLGTVGYLAPEIAFGEGSNALSDQFSFAVTLYATLYGVRPFPSRDLMHYLEQCLVPPREPKRADVPAWLRKVALRGLSPEPANRFPSLDALLAALDADPALKRRRMAFWATGLLTLVALLAVGQYALRKRENICNEDPSIWEGIYSSKVRAALHEAFTRAGGPAGGPAADRVAERLEAFVRDWTTMHVAVCRASKVDKVQPEDVRKLKNDCLEREFGEVRSISAMLLAADKRTVSRATEIAYGLPQTSWCADVNTLRASAGLPDDPGKRTKVLEIRKRLAEIRARELGGKIADALTLTEETLALARAADHPATLAEVLEKKGDVLGTKGEWEADVETLAEGVYVAESVGADALVTFMANGLTFAAGAKLQHPAEGRIWLNIAKAALRRMGGDEHLQSFIEDTEGSLYLEMDWRPDLAAPLFERSLATARRLHGPSLQTDNALSSLVVARMYLGDFERARTDLREQRELTTKVWGPASFNVHWNSYMLGTCEIDLGNFTEGERLVSESIADFEREGEDYWAAIALQSLLWAKEVQGDDAAALTIAERSLKHLADAKKPSVLVPIVSVPSAFAFLHAGRAKEALALCDDALREHEKANMFVPEKAYWADSLRCKGEALMTLGRAKDAVPPLERSLTMKHRMFPGDYARAEFALARALVATHGDHERAMSLARSARDLLAQTPFLAKELSAVRTWLERAGS